MTNAPTSVGCRHEHGAGSPGCVTRDDPAGAQPRFSALPRREREALLDCFRHLAAHPFQTGDYHETAQNGAPLEVRLVVDAFLVTWHTDHATKEVRIVGLDVV